jgi:hypothetical protein
MTHFDENSEYWGDKIKPIIGAANGRFTARSVKIFGDGKPYSLPELSELNYHFRRSTIWWGSCKFNQLVLVMVLT